MRPRDDVLDLARQLLKRCQQAEPAQRHGQTWSSPPEATAIVCPVRNEASGASAQSTAAATSPGSTNRASGSSAATAPSALPASAWPASTSALARAAKSGSPGAGPTATAFAVIDGASSSAT